MKIINIIIICVCFLYIFLSCNQSNADPLDDIDRTILETMKGNQRADTVNNKQKENKPIIQEDKNEDRARQSPRRNVRQDTTRQQSTRNTRETYKEKDRYGEEIRSLQIGSYRVTVNIQKNWYVHNQNSKHIALVNRSKTSAVVIDVKSTGGMNTQRLCSNFMNIFQNTRVTLSVPEYCSFEGTVVSKTGIKKIDAEVFNDRQYYTTIVVVGDISAGKEVSCTVQRSSTQ